MPQLRHLHAALSSAFAAVIDYVRVDKYAERMRIEGEVRSRVFIEIKLSMLRCLNGIDTVTAHFLKKEIRLAMTSSQLWSMKTVIFQEIACYFGEQEAIKRFQRVDFLFASIGTTSGRS